MREIRPVRSAVRALFLLAVPFLLAPPARSQPTLIWEFTGATGDLFGWSVAGLGDLNGDLRSEVIVGATGVSNYAKVFSGLTGTALYTMTPVERNNFGASVAGVGDVDGDDVPDYAVGAEGGNFTAGPPGYVKVFSGSTGGELFTLGGVGSGIPNTSHFGQAVAGVGDVNADSVPDILVGAPSVYGVPSGFANLYSGATHLLIGAIGPFFQVDNLGASLAALGDVSGDGIPDFAIGAPTEDGPTAPFGVVRFRTGVSPYNNLDELGPQGIFTLGSFGVAIANVGPVDLDAFADVAIVCSFAGTVIVSGDSRNEIYTIPAAAGGDGTSVAGLGDVNGDGFPDFAIGGSTATESIARVFCTVSGEQIASITAPLFDSFENVGNAGDVDGDGKNDLVVGAWGGDYARVYSLASVPACLPPNFRARCRIAFQRDPLVPDADASGTLSMGIQNGVQTFVVVAKKLDDLGGTYDVVLEDAPGIGTYTDVGDLTLTNANSGQWLLELEASGTIAKFGGANLTSLAGRRIELRQGSTVYLFAVLPPLPCLPNVKLAGFLPAAPGSPAPGASATLKLQFKGAAGTSKFDLKTKGLAVGPAYTAWISDSTAESPAFTEIGALVKGKLKIDTKRGQPLPLGVGFVTDLSGRTLEVRDGATVLLSGTIP